MSYGLRDKIMDILGNQKKREEKETQEFIKELNQLCEKYQRVLAPSIQVMPKPPQNAGVNPNNKS